MPTPDDAARIADALMRMRLGRIGAHTVPGQGHDSTGRSMARGRLLHVLAEAAEPLSVGEVAELIGVDQPRASRLVQAVVDVGHAQREPDPADARRQRIRLTEEGRQFVVQAHQRRREAVAAALAALDEDERSQLAALLTRLAAAWPES